MKMNKILAFFITVITLSILTSCEKDININDDYKDITIVYGLLDPDDSISYLRIEKAFLSDGDIFQAAQVPDSNLYSYKLDVKITNDQGNVIAVFDTMTIYNKEDGIFYAPRMIVYYAVTKARFNDRDTYYLEINNPKTGAQITSTTKVIDARKMRIDKPNLNMSFAGNYAVEYTSLKDIRLYQVNIRFYYGEENIVTGDSTGYYTDWILPSVASRTLSGGEDLETPYSGEVFYSNLLNTIPIKDNVVRYIGPIDVIISCADETFNIYMEINKPSASLVIDRPDYTNIENGFGLFASRSTKVKATTMNSKSKAILWKIEELNFQRAGK
jgi:hypothetical protein